MKKLFLCLVLILSFVFPAWAANFVEIIRDDTMLVYLDIDSIEERDQHGRSYVVAWAKWIPRNEVAKEFYEIYNTKDFDFQMDFDAYDKQSKRFQTLSRTVYNKKGGIISSQSRQFLFGKYEEIIPGSYGDIIYNAVMFHYNKR